MKALPTRFLLLSVCVAMLIGDRGRLLAADAPADSSQASALHQAQMKWWRAAKFGLFLHWGIYAVPADGEWYMQNHAVPRADYEKFAAQFNPTQFDAGVWADLARDSGQKYVVITAKHNDGFCMFKTTANPYNVVDATPWHRDPIAELGEACRKDGLHFGCYYSLSCWHNPHQTVASGNPARPPYHPTNLGGPEQKAAYIKDVRAELKDLIASGHPDIIWFDGGDVRGWTAEDGVALCDYLRSLDPKLIFNSRALGGGDFANAEGGPMQDPIGKDWEMVETINGSWGFSEKDHNFKSSDQLLGILIDAASNGGNFLLNVGPTAQGLIPETAVARLEGVGDWLNTNGDAIYGTTAGPFKHPFPWGRSTQKPGKLFAIIQHWPGDKLLLPISNVVTKAYLLNNPAVILKTEQTDEGVRVHLPPPPSNVPAWVLATEIDGAPKVIEHRLPQSADGSITLTPRGAELHGSSHLTVENDPPNIGGWNVIEDYPEWTVQVRTPGTFTAELTYALNPPADGTRVVLAVGDQKIPITLEPTTGWQAYRTIKLPDVKIEKAGPLTINFKASKMPGAGVMNFRALTLKPAPAQ